MNIIRVLFVSMTIVLTSLPVCYTAFAEALPEVVKKVRPSVVGVGFYAPLATVSHQLKGTGFVVGNGKYVVTNHHVITAFPTEENVKFNQVVFVPEGRKMGIARVKQVYKDEEHDLAILEMAHELTPVSLLSATDVVEDGTAIAMTGFPIGAVLGLYPATHRGIVAAYTPNVISASNSAQLSQAYLDSLRNPFMVYQLDITAYPGNSGSPVYKAATGEVLGVINKVFVKKTKESAITSPSGITYAIPVKHVYALAEKHGITL